MVSSDGIYQSALLGRGTSCRPATPRPSPAAAGPLGPCSQPASGPFLSSYGSVAGPGGGSLFTDASGNWWLGYAGWPSSCTNYSCGGVRRLFVAPIDLGTSIEVPCHRPSGAPVGYRMTASDGGIFNFGNLPFCGSTGGIILNQPVVGMAGTSDGGGYWTVARDGGIFSFGDAHFYGSTGGYPPQPAHRGHGGDPRRPGVLAGGRRRRHLLLRGRLLLRLDRGHPPQPAHRGHGGHARRARATGWWPPTEGSSPSATPPSTARPGPSTSTSPSWAWRPRPDGHGYWLVAADGGIFTFGDATFYGSTGAIHLNQPIVGMASASGGRGVLAGGRRRRHLLLRERPLLRLDRGHPPQPTHRGGQRLSRRGPVAGRPGQATGSRSEPTPSARKAWVWSAGMGGE